MLGILRKSFGASFITLAAVLGLCYSTSSLGQTQVNPPCAQKHKHHHGKGFQRGICVGQTLAQQGVILPQRQPGQRPAYDPATKAAFQAAVQSCKAQYKGTKSPSS
jgi:hypothetical protein